MNGEISGYYNESWSEAEICKTLLNPAESGFQIDSVLVLVKVFHFFDCIENRFEAVDSYTIKQNMNVDTKMEILKFVSLSD